MMLSFAYVAHDDNIFNVFVKEWWQKNKRWNLWGEGLGIKMKKKIII